MLIVADNRDEKIIETRLGNIATSHIPFSVFPQNLNISGNTGMGEVDIRMIELIAAKIAVKT